MKVKERTLASKLEKVQGKDGGYTRSGLWYSSPFVTFRRELNLYARRTRGDEDDANVGVVGWKRKRRKYETSGKEGQGMMTLLHEGLLVTHRDALEELN